VTQVSGRGIGLDIVHSRVLELKGSFDVQSETGSGCRFTIRLPATLLSAHALLVRHGEHTVAIASRGIRQILDSQSCKVAILGTRLTLQVGREIYEAQALQSLLGTPLPENQPLAPQPALLVEIAADRLCAVLVPSVLDTVDLVVKPLGAFVPRAAGVVGATILGNGSVAPVVDLPELLRAGAREQTVNRYRATSAVSGPTSNKLQQPSVLVVDDSLSVRRSMEQLLRDSGYAVRLARDGLEAVAMIEAEQPDLLLVDLEMPRMNGMELTAHVRNRAQTRGLPVIMITSRSTEKHRKQAETAGVNHYMTKPFADEVLLAQMDTLLKRSA
jgi:chemosensory pili system protein ChpA (sensor histidine kinase/response regulator)